MPAGHTSAHSPYTEHGPNSSSAARVMPLARRLRSFWLEGSVARCMVLDPANSWAEPLGHAATHAPQPMHAARSSAHSADSWDTGMASASGAVPTEVETKPPASITRSSALRSTARSLTTGNAPLRNGSSCTVAPSSKERRCCRQDGVFS